MPRFHVTQVAYGTGNGEQIATTVNVPIEMPQPGANGNQLWVIGGTGKLAAQNVGALSATVDIAVGGAAAPTSTMGVFSNYPPNHCTFRPLYVTTQLPAGTASVTIQGANPECQWDSNDTIQILMIELDT